MWEKRVPGEEGTIEVLRMKGLVWVERDNRKTVLQGVRELYDKQDGGIWGNDEERWSRLVFIGKNLDRHAMSRSFVKHCL